MLYAMSINAQLPDAPDGKTWRLEWSETFDKTQIDTEIWSKIPRGEADWRKYMSDDASLFEIRDGNLVLRGIVNPSTAADTSKYLTGGLWTKGKKNFEPGLIMVRAKLQGGKGVWPAIWLLPSDDSKPWPVEGEVDIMERLSSQQAVHQTVHSYYTYNLGHKTDPVNTRMVEMNPEEYNTYAAAILPDKVMFYINGKETFNYPKINDGAEQQYPFYREMYLIIDMQLGGWAGDIDPKDLPVEMLVDKIEYYKPDVISGAGDITDDSGADFCICNKDLEVSNLKDSEVCRVYNLQGMLVGETRGEAIRNLPSGMLIVTLPGTARKVMVK